MFVSSFIWSVFFSKNYVLKFSIFVCGIGFNILGGLSVVFGIQRVSNVLVGICSVTEEWSELR